jgi:hypothetical protein
MSKEDRRDLVHFIHSFIFMPGGRYIYYGGRGANFYNNCFSAGTILATKAGNVRMGDVAGQEVEVLSPVTGEHYPATVHAHGVQPVYDITFKMVGRSAEYWKHTQRATRDHKWALKGGSATEQIGRN